MIFMDIVSGPIVFEQFRSLLGERLHFRIVTLLNPYILFRLRCIQLGWFVSSYIKLCQY